MRRATVGPPLYPPDAHLMPLLGKAADVLNARGVATPTGKPCRRSGMSVAAAGLWILASGALPHRGAGAGILDETALAPAPQSAAAAVR
jgi:hypothetical protein